jgi:hypothetical protein
MRSWKLEFEALLQHLGSLLSAAGFRTYIAMQSFKRNTKIGTDTFHIQRGRHFDGMNISADAAIRCDAIETFLYDLYQGVMRPGKLGPEINKGMATLGKGVGYLVPQGRLQMWPVRNADDAKEVAAKLFESYVTIAEPYFFRTYTSLQTIYDALNDDDARQLTIGGYQTARTVIVAAILLKLNERELSALIRSKARALEDSAESDWGVKKFREFLSRLHAAHPDVKFQDPFLHS